MLSAVICLFLLVQMPLSVFSFADVKINTGIDLAKETEYNDTVEILEEDISKRGEYEKHFLQSDGTYLAVSYSDPVHKKAEDGSYEEIDNTLSLKNGRLENADKDFKVSFAEKSEKGLIQISYDEYEISWGLSSFTDKKTASDHEQTTLPVHSDELSAEKAKMIEDTTTIIASEVATETETSKVTAEPETSEVVTETETETATVAVTETSEAATETMLSKETTAEPKTSEDTTEIEPVFEDALAEVRTFKSVRTAEKAVVFDKTEELEQLTEKERKVAASKISSGLVYNDILGDGIDARYSVNPGRIKEDIVLDTPSDFSGYAMDITAEDLTAVKAENNTVEFLNADGKAVFVIQTPYMYDAADNISYDIDIEIEETADGYRIILTPETEWLNAEERVYPIVIDPTVTSSRTLSNAHDTYIYDGGGNTGGTGDRMYVGIKSTGTSNKVHRAYWRVISLPSLGNSYAITSASFIVQFPSGTTTSRPFSLYGVDGSWSESTLTWANRPDETLLVSGVDRSNLTATFSGSDVTQRVKDWYTEAKSNDGFMIRYTSESLTNPDYNSIWTCDGSTASYVPYFSITYTAFTETWTLQGRLKNVTEGPDYFAQGFAVGTDYCYSVNVDNDDENHKLYRKNMNNSSDAELMTGTGTIDSLGHSNDMTLATYTESGGTVHRYLYVVANGGTITNSYIVKLEYSGTTYWQVARYNLGAVYTSISRVKYYNNANNEPMVQFLLRSGNYGYYTASVRRAQTGTYSLSTTHRFNVTRPSAYTSYNNQGIHYENDTLYVPLFGYNSNATPNPNKPKENVILVYGGIDNAIANTQIDSISNSKAVTIEAVNTDISLFEIESIGFPVNNPNLNNDLLWFNTNKKIGVDRVNGGIYCDSQDIK
jgi:hypothetical protein